MLHIERFMFSIKAECLSRLILFGEKMLRRASAVLLPQGFLSGFSQFSMHVHHDQQRLLTSMEYAHPGMPERA